MAHNLYVTGTDTAVGKTRCSLALLHLLQRGGRNAVGMKPVASGCEASSAGWRNEDALALQSIGRPWQKYEHVNPFALPAATAPQIAAALCGATVTLGPILTAFDELHRAAGHVLVEGVGGWLAPLADELQQSDLARALDLDVVLVVGLKLGCLNHARLTENAIAADGLRLVGWIGNAVAPVDEYSDAYVELLRTQLRAPCLGLVPHAPAASPAEDAAHLALPEERRTSVLSAG